MAGECVAQAASKESLTWCNGAAPANSGPLLCTRRIKAADPGPRYAEYDSDVTVECRVARGAEVRFETMAVRECWRSMSEVNTHGSQQECSLSSA